MENQRTQIQEEVASRFPHRLEASKPAVLLLCCKGGEGVGEADGWVGGGGGLKSLASVLPSSHVH